MQRKKRILMCNDAHFMFTGYGKYGNEVLNRLADTDKYELAELGCFAELGDQRDMYARWMFYPNQVSSNHPTYNIYRSGPQNPFGRWRFERVLLDFKPDIVFDIRDPWMLSFEQMSPLRPFYSWAIMPTVDSAPQKESWLEMFMDADGVFTYSDYGTDVLNKESNRRINTVASAPPGVDIDVFRPVQNKRAHKQRMGFDPDCNIIGTIMRNQGRKLYPDLFATFKTFLNNCYNEGREDLAKNTFLYAHCSYPDMGWEIPELLREHGIGRKVLFTYICKSCQRPFMAFFRDARTVCPHCSHVSAVLPSPGTGLSPHQLSEVLNSFDVYIQYAVCEGFGMPQVEAASCGVPVMSVDYSAMADVVRKLGGVPLKVERMFRDVGTNSYRALPNNDECAKEISSFFRKPAAIRRRMGNNARKAVEKYYTWDNTAQIWDSYFDSVELTGLQGKWDSPMLPCGNPPPIPQKGALSNSAFIDWLIINVMKEPKLLNTRFAMKYLRQLNYGGRPAREDEMEPVNQEVLYREFGEWAKNKLECERARCGIDTLSPMDYIDYAHSRAEFLND